MWLKFRLKRSVVALLEPVVLALTSVERDPKQAIARFKADLPLELAEETPPQPEAVGQPASLWGAPRTALRSQTLRPL